MKKFTVLTFVVLLGTFFSCSEPTSENITVADDAKNVESTQGVDIPFIGTWSREFSMGEGINQQVSYTITDTEIVYAMTGSMPMDYSIEYISFDPKDNRWIGKKGTDTYVIFVKDMTDESITLFKQKVDNPEAGSKMEFPSATSRSQFTSWNVYKKVQ